MVPLPVPLAPEMMWIQAAAVLAVQLKLVLAVTVIDPGLPTAAAAALTGLKLRLGCSMATMRSPSRMYSLLTVGLCAARLPAKHIKVSGASANPGRLCVSSIHPPRNSFQLKQPKIAVRHSFRGHVSISPAHQLRLTALFRHRG